MMQAFVKSFQAFLAAASLFAAACASAAPLEGSGQAATEERPVPAFTGIAVSMPARVEVATGAPAALSITADDNLLARLESTVALGVLTLRFPEGLQVSPRTPIRIEVRTPSLDSIHAAGAVSVQASGVRGSRLAVEMAGAARLELPRLDVDLLDGKISGRGELLASGRADALELHMTGSARIDAGALESQRARIAINGSGYVVIWARESIDATLIGSGYVRFVGERPSAQKVAADRKAEHARAAAKA